MLQSYSDKTRGLLKDLELGGALNNEKNFHLFCCACCRLIQNKLPEIAQSALEIAETYNEEFVNVKEIKVESERLWNYLGKDYVNVFSPNVAAVRAVLCCLFERPLEEHLFLITLNAMDLCNFVENKEREQYEILSSIVSGSDKT